MKAVSSGTSDFGFTSLHIQLFIRTSMQKAGSLSAKFFVQWVANVGKHSIHVCYSATTDKLSRQCRHIYIYIYRRLLVIHSKLRLRRHS